MRNNEKNIENRMMEWRDENDDMENDRREIRFTSLVYTIEGITREYHIQILSQTSFCMLILGRVIIYSLRSRSST